MRVEIGGSKIIDLDHYNLMQGVVQVATGGESHDLKGNRAYNSMSSVAQLDPATREGQTVFDYDIPLSLLMTVCLNMIGLCCHCSCFLERRSRSIQQTTQRQQAPVATLQRT
jgi:hypothetical protein